MSEAKALVLVGTHEVRDNDPAVQRRDTHPVWAFEADVLPHGERHGGMRAKRWAHRLVTFVGFDHLRNAPNRGIRRQAEAFPQFVVRELLQGNLVRTLLRKGDVPPARLRPR